MNLYFRLTYIPAPYTIYDGIHKLEPYNYISFDIRQNDLQIRSIDQAKSVVDSSDISFEEARDKTKELVYESVASRSISDVPLGTFLSGGVDSSIVSLCLAQYKETPIETFSIGFKRQEYDETNMVK